MIVIGKVPTIGVGLDRVQYWRFLCAVYRMGALEAWNYIKRCGAPPSLELLREAISGPPRSYCYAPKDYPYCDCANKCDGCNEHLSLAEMEHTMKERDDVRCGRCIRGGD